MPEDGKTFEECAFETLINLRMLTSAAALSGGEGEIVAGLGSIVGQFESLLFEPKDDGDDSTD